MEPAAEPRRLAGTWSEFRSDVGAALAVWRSAPWVVVIGVLFRSGTITSPGMTPGGGEAAFPGGGVLLFMVIVLASLVAVFLFGWAGAERLVHAWVWGGSPVTFRLALSAALGYIGRFFVLGLIVLVPLLVTGFALSTLVGPVVANGVTSFLVGVVLTFVTPALAFDEQRATAALATGWRMLVGQGSGVLWYAVMGPALLTLLSGVASAPNVRGWLAWVAMGLCALALRGATAAAYLRLTRPEGITAPPPAGP